MRDLEPLDDDELERRAGAPEERRYRERTLPERSPQSSLKQVMKSCVIDDRVRDELAMGRR